MSKKFIAVVTEDCSCNYHELGEGTWDMNLSWL